MTTAADPHREECTMKHTKKITILHSNDLHGDFLAEQVDEKLVGGVSMLSGYIEKVRAEEPNTIYAIAGDMFRGSVIDSEYKGLSTIEIMNALAPDVVTIGNHEVDYGIAHLLFIEKCARFPIINANLYIKNTPTRLFTPYKILRVDGMNILFIGIIPQDKELVETFIQEARQTMPDARVQYAVTADIHDKFDVIINASPVGMFPKVDACPVSDELIDGADYFFDVIYNPTKTLFLRKALEKGKVAKGGAAMLVLQAVRAHEIWNDDSYTDAQIDSIIGDMEELIDEQNAAK